MTIDTLKKLRNGKNVILFDRIDKLFVGFKLNSTNNKICWKKFVSKDRKNWVLQNEYLSLKDINNTIINLKNKIELSQSLILTHL